MPLLQIIQDAHTEIGLDGLTPTTVVGNPDVNVQRLFRFATRVCRDLATRAPWTRLRTVASFTAVAAEVQPFVVPQDCHRIIPDTFWDETNSRNIAGPLAPGDYQQLRVTLAPASAPSAYFTRQSAGLLLWPPPSGGEAMSFQYQSLSFCRGGGGSGDVQQFWLADTDVARFSEELVTLGVIAMFYAAEAQPTAALARQEYERRLATEIRADVGTSSTAAVDDFFGGGARRSTGNVRGGAGGGFGWWY